MTLHEFLTSATATLTQAGIETARLDCLVLLEDVCGRGRASLLAHPELKITKSQEAALHTKIAQRAKHIPLAYIRHKVMFYGREFTVDQHVLCPRPETEAMIDLVKEAHFPLQAALPLRFADVGTGSGCIGITVALEIPNATVELWDIDMSALRIAASNARQHGLTLDCRQHDLLERLPLEYYDALLANLPYVPNGYAINRAAEHEPKLALFAGEDGLDLYRRFWKQLKAQPRARKPRYAFTESFPHQHEALNLLAASAQYNLVRRHDFVQQFQLTN